MMTQVQEGLVTMNDIIKGTKEQNLISLSHQQTLLTEQNKKLKDMVDNIQAQVYGRQAAIEAELGDSRAKIQEIESVVVKNVTQANRTVEQELGRFEKIIAALEKYTEQQINELKQLQAAGLDEWRTSKGDNLAEVARKQDDLATNTSLIAQNLSKIEEDARDRAQMIRDELRSLEAA